MEFMCLVFTCMPGESYRGPLWSLLYLRCVFRMGSLMRIERKKNVNKSDVIMIIVTIMTSMVRCPRADDTRMIWQAMTVVRTVTSE